MKDKDIKSMLKIISPLALTIVFTKIINQRAAKPSELLKIFEDIKGKNQNDAKIVNNPKKALQFARKISKKDELVVICGSIYLVGAIRN